MARFLWVRCPACATRDKSVFHQATITADTNAGNKGNTLIQTDNLLLRDASLISTNAGNSLNGGNINITTDTLLAFYNSDITVVSSVKPHGMICDLY